MVNNTTANKPIRPAVRNFQRHAACQPLVKWSAHLPSPGAAAEPRRSPGRSVPALPTEGAVLGASPGESVAVYVVPLPAEGAVLGASPGESVAVYVVPLPAEGAVLGASPRRV